MQNDRKSVFFNKQKRNVDWGIGFAEPLAAAGILTTENKMPLRSHLIFVCPVSSPNQFGWIPPNKNKMVLSDHLIFYCGRNISVIFSAANLKLWRILAAWRRMCSISR